MKKKCQRKDLNISILLKENVLYFWSVFKTINRNQDVFLIFFTSNTELSKLFKGVGIIIICHAQVLLINI